jgi:hypothetical protein
MNTHTYVPPADAETISAMYIELKMTQREIAVVLGCSRKAIATALRRYKIPIWPAIPRDQTGSRNARWKGDQAQYQALHLRVAQLRGKPSLCETCGTTTATAFDWANLTGDYKNPMDYKRLCRSCHSKMDRTIRNINGP